MLPIIKGLTLLIVLVWVNLKLNIILIPRIEAESMCFLLKPPLWAQVNDLKGNDFKNTIFPRSFVYLIELTAIDD